MQTILRPHTKFIGGLLGIAAVLLLAGCGSPFERRWNAAQSGRSGDPYTGRWAGSWQSRSGKHKGALECVLVSKSLSASSQTARAYTAHFHAHWGPFASSYQVPLSARQTSGALMIQGSQDLGTLQGGVYTYEGSVTPGRFFATYYSKFDRGTFTLSRPHLQRLHAGSN